MIRYVLLILMILAGSANAEEFEKCGYVPQSTLSYKFPEWELFENCAYYKGGVLKISEDHIASLNFGEINMARFFTEGQHFYVKPNGDFLPVIFYDNGADYYREGLTRSLVNGKISYFDYDFKLVLSPGYDWAWPFQEGKALVCKGCALTPVEDGHKLLEGGLWGYINKAGVEVVPVIYKASEVPRN